MNTPLVRRRTTTQALVEFLSVQYSERDGVRRRVIPGLYGIFGHGNAVGLGQAVEELGVDFPHYQGKNEQSMVHAAIGFARANLRLSTLACTASMGPGSTNMLTGAATATMNRVPVLILPSDSFTHRRGDPVLQDVEHPVYRDVTPNDAFRPVSRYWDRLVCPEQLLSTAPEAVRVLLDPADTGAVTIALPQDVQGQVYDFPEEFFRPRVWTVSRRPAAEEELRAALELLRGAKRPLIIAGGGVRYSAAEAELARLSSEFGIPVTETYAGKGVGPGGALNLGGIGRTGTLAANRIAKTADVVLCIGTRLQDFITGSASLFQNPDVRLVNVNVGTFDAYKLNAQPVVGDAKLTLAWLNDALAGAGYATGEEYRTDIARAMDAWEEMRLADLGPHPGEMICQAQVVRKLNECTGTGDVLVAASGGVVLDAHRMWDPTNGCEVHIEFAASCMGHEIPAGLGYALARPDAEGAVFVLIGDGTYLMQPTELVTAAQEGAKVITVVVDNAGHQCIRGLQVAMTDVEFGTQLRARDPQTGRLTGRVIEVDFVANARSLGCEAWLAETLEEFEQAIAAARAVDGPSVIVVPVEPFRGLSENECFWDVGVAEVSGRAEIQERSDAHLVERRAVRFYPASTPVLAD